MTGPPLLLDTHAFAWAIIEPSRLSPKARAALGDRNGPVLVSTVCVWEMAIKHRQRRWADAVVILADIEGALARADMIPLPCTIADGALAGSLDWRHKDPFDRMLAAQTIARQGLLITADHAFAASGVPVLWD